MVIIFAPAEGKVRGLEDSFKQKLRISLPLYRYVF